VLCRACRFRPRVRIVGPFDALQRQQVLREGFEAADLPVDDSGRPSKVLAEARLSLPQGSGGLRKIRWRLPGAGKRGSLRVIYYYWDARDTVFMLFPYRKTEQDDLTPDQLRRLRAVVKEYLE